MSATPKVSPEASPVKLGQTGVRRVNIMPIFIICGGFAALLLVMGMVAYDRARLPAYPNLTVKPPVQATEVVSLPEPPESEGIPPVAVLSPVAERAAVNSDGFCNGYEIFCSTTTTDKPAETLQKLATAMPQGNDKHYRVVVSVVVESPPKE